MVNYWLMLGPIGMIAVGIAAFYLWQRKKKVDKTFYLWGTITWFLAIIAKAVIDFTVTSGLFDAINNVVPEALVFIVATIVGLRTGFFESGLSYVIFQKKFKKISWNEGIALGIGFGGTEAILLGVMSLVSMVMLMNPLFLQGLTEAETQMVTSYLDQNTFVIFASWIERAFTLFAHVFATALVVKTLSTGKTKYVWLSILYKALLDAPVPFFQVLLSNGTVATTYLIELYIVGMGVIGLYGLKWLSETKKPLAKKTKPKKAKKR